MKRILGTLAVLAVVAAPSLAAADLDAPHDMSFATLNCDNCHSLTTTSPSGKADYSLGCLTCHNKPGRLYPWAAGDQAVPGQGGNQHSWSGYADSPAHGAKSPAGIDYVQRLVDGKLQCSVCHDAHRGNAAYAPASRKTTIPVGTPTPRTGGSGAGTLTLTAVGTNPKSFRVKVSTAGGVILSHDYGLSTPSWFNWSGSAWIAGTDNGPGRTYTAGTAFALDDATVTVSLSAGAVAGDYWDFTISYPFARASVVGDQLCLQCHADRVMSSQRARGDDPYIKPNGARLFSHPVGEALGQNGKGYDRTAGILDANGALQSVGDGNVNNDLTLQSSTVMCTTCHAVHNADSNSLTQ